MNLGRVQWTGVEGLGFLVSVILLFKSMGSYDFISILLLNKLNFLLKVILYEMLLYISHII